MKPNDMKAITWNCNMAFRKKAPFILTHKPDILGSHSSVVEQLEKKGIFSTYHVHHKQMQETEEHPTFLSRLICRKTSISRDWRVRLLGKA
jgi:hypothetical protein